MDSMMSSNAAAVSAVMSASDREVRMRRLPPASTTRSARLSPWPGPGTSTPSKLQSAVSSQAPSSAPVSSMPLPGYPAMVMSEPGDAEMPGRVPSAVMKSATPAPGAGSSMPSDVAHGSAKRLSGLWKPSGAFESDSQTTHSMFPLYQPAGTVKVIRNGSTA